MYTIRFIVAGDSRFEGSIIEEQYDVENIEVLIEQSFSTFRKSLGFITSSRGLESHVLFEKNPSPHFTLECEEDGCSIEVDPILEGFFFKRVQNLAKMLENFKAPS